MKSNEINTLLEKVASKMQLGRQEVAERIPVIDEELINVLNHSLEIEPDDDDNAWIEIKPEILLTVKPLMHPEFENVYVDKKQLSQAMKDAKDGITFAFYWKDNFLCWER